MLLKPTITLLFLVNYVQLASSYKILTYCAQFGQSHLFFMGGISDQLAEAGHNVTFLQPEVVHTIKHTGAKLANVLIRKADFPREELLGQKDVWKGDFTATDVYTQFKAFGHLLSMSCYHMLKDEELMERLKRENFDLGIGEHYDSCTYALFHRLGIRKFISAFAVPIYPQALSQLGMPVTASYIPSMSSTSTPEMSYRERAINFITSHIFYWVGRYTMGIPMDRAISRALGYEFRAIEHVPQSSYYFVNTDEHFDHIQPITHKVVYMGGMRLKEPKPLPTEFEKIVKQSVRGIVLISFGTVALSSKMPNQTKAEFVEFISNFPDITFIWKYETPEDGYVPNLSNLVLRSWLPQSDLLAHPKMLAFITHSGMNSVSEAAQRGVPMIAIPLFGDQQKNSQMVKFRGIGRVVKRAELTAKTLTNELNILMSPHEQYRENSKHLSRMIREKPFPAHDRVVLYSEHAIRFNVSENLDLYARRLSAIQFYGLDVYAPIAVMLSLITYVVYFLLSRSLRVIARLVIVKNKVD